jgi:hypothetical protein
MNTKTKVTNRSDDFVIYHSTEGMGYEYKPKGSYSWFSRKSRKFLDRAIGCNVWMITGTRDSNKRMIYRLVGTFTPSEIRDNPGDPGLHIIYGEQGSELHPPLVLNDLDWFRELYRAQNKFSFGFSTIHGEQVLAGLRSAMQP